MIFGNLIGRILDKNSLDKSLVSLKNKGVLSLALYDLVFVFGILITLGLLYVSQFLKNKGKIGSV